MGIDVCEKYLRITLYFTSLNDPWPETCTFCVCNLKMSSMISGHDNLTEGGAAASVPQYPAIFQDPKWLGFRHDGYPVSAFFHYRETRGIPNPTLFDREHVAMLQGWLSFGLLEAVLEAPIPESKLIKHEENGSSLSLDSLPEIISEWQLRVQGLGTNITAHREKVEAILLQTQKILSYLSDSQAFNYAGADEDDVPATFVTLGCIAEAVTQARLCLYPDDAPGRGYDWGFVVAPYHKKFYAEAVVDGWCLSTVSYLVNKTNLSALRYAIRRGPLIREDHGACTAQFCALKTVDTSNYVPKHLGDDWDADCSCSYIHAEAEMVISTIQDGANPVVKLQGPLLDRNRSSLAVSASTGVPYVAISHVWADGSGSTAEVGLPLCQVWKLAALVSSILPSGAFWMDALCVPKDQDTRRKALKLMGRAYLDAEIVLVLDSTIKKCSAEAPPNELLLHVVLSPWMRRLWTLQEAVLAKKVIFMFSDGLVPLSKLIPNASSLCSNAIQAGFAAEVHRLTKLRLFDSLGFADVARSLRWRWTSNTTDEVPAIVSLLKVDRQAIFEDLVENRMANLLLAVAHLPRNIIFLSGSKMRILNFSWAPATLMSIASGGDEGGLELNTTDATALCTTNGLQARYFVFSFEKRTFRAGERWSFRDPTSGRVFFISSTLSKNESYCCNYLLCSRLEAPLGIENCIAVLGNVVASTATLNCSYGCRLLINGQQRLDIPMQSEAILLASRVQQVCIS